MSACYVIVTQAGTLTKEDTELRLEMKGEAKSITATQLY